jgi:hypothetical protein
MFGTIVPMPRQSLNPQPFLMIEDEADIKHHSTSLCAAADHIKQWLTNHRGNPVNLLHEIKFEPIGRHPVEDRPLNLIEQINQFWTYAVALAAVRELLRLHPDVGGFKVAPGAHMALPLDIMSLDGDVGAETFAAVHPNNNRKLARDLAILAGRPERHRYVFFGSPAFPGLKRRPALETGGAIQVWSVDLLACRP